MVSFKGKHIVITGASSGIGRAIAMEFARLGANLTLGSRNHNNLSLATKEATELGAECIFITTDVSSESDCQNLIQKAIDRFGEIDVLINNAGVSMRALFSEVQMDVLKKVINTNFWGTVYCTKAALESIRKTKGSLVAISSVSGFKGLPGRTAYSASKFAIHGFYESLRMEHHAEGMHVMVACPGWTNTNIRKNALSANGTEQEESPRNEQAMDSAQNVALDIIQGIRDRREFLVNSKLGKRIFWLNKYFPRYVEKQIYKEMSRETGSPIK